MVIPHSLSVFGNVPLPVSLNLVKFSSGVFVPLVAAVQAGAIAFRGTFVVLGIAGGTFGGFRWEGLITSAKHHC